MIGDKTGLQIHCGNLLNCIIFIKSDNSSTVTYINKCAACQSNILNNTTRQIYKWVMKINRWHLQASLIPDKKSQQPNSSQDKIAHTVKWIRDIFK